MAKIDATVVRQQEATWLFTWTAGTAPYEIWLDGIQLESAVATETYTSEIPGYETSPPPLEIRDAGDTAESSLYPPYVILQWYGIPTADAYVIERLIGASWINQANFMEDGSGYYRWASQALADETSHQYRVTALSLAGAEGTAVTFTSEMTRNPPPPDVSFAFTAGDVVVSAS